jgi:hypothetical protein
MQLDKNSTVGATPDLSEYIEQNSVILVSNKDIDPKDLIGFEPSMGCIIGCVFCFFDEEKNLKCVEMMDTNSITTDVSTQSFRLKDKLEMAGFNVFEDPKLISRIKKIKDKYKKA